MMYHLRLGLLFALWICILGCNPDENSCPEDKNEPCPQGIDSTIYNIPESIPKEGLWWGLMNCMDVEGTSYGLHRSFYEPPTSALNLNLWLGFSRKVSLSIDSLPYTSLAQMVSPNNSHNMALYRAAIFMDGIELVEDRYTLDTAFQNIVSISSNIEKDSIIGELNMRMIVTNDKNNENNPDTLNFNRCKFRAKIRE